jgi:hypothetical protein
VFAYDANSLEFPSTYCIMNCKIVCAPATLQEHGILSQLALAEQQAVCVFQNECQEDTLSFFQLQLSMDDAMQARLTAFMVVAAASTLSTAPLVDFEISKAPDEAAASTPHAEQGLGRTKDGTANCTAQSALAYGF